MIDKQTFVSYKCQVKLCCVLAALQEKPMTREEVQELLHMSKPTARRYLTELRQLGHTHIIEWRSSVRGRFSAVHAFGAGESVPQPAGMTKRERNAEQWRRIKEDRDKHDRVKAAARVQSNIQRVRVKPQTWFSALEAA